MRGAQTNAADAIAIGGQSSALATSGIALGRGATVNGAFGVAQGDGVTSGATGRNVAIGSTGTTANSTTANGGAVAIGRGQFATGDGAVAIGDPNTANGTGTVAMGANNTAAGNTAGTSAANGAVALGNGNSAIGQGSVALGNTSTAQAAGGIALGDTARSLGGNGTAIGSGATANNASDVALGAGSTTAAPSTGTTALYGATASGIAKAASGTASVGTAGNERQIQNVAAGTISGTSTDAVNGSQLNSVSTGVNALGNSTATTLGAGATYSSTTGAISGFSQPVNTVSTTGALGATTQQTTVGGALTALNTSVGNNANIAVKYDAVGGNTVTLGATGGAGAPAGGVRVTNVTPATLSATSTDAVNGSQLFTTNQNVAGNTTAINSINNGAGIKYFHTNSTLADSTATGTNSVVVGPNASATATNAMALGNGAVAGTANSIALGSGATTAAANPNTGGTINGVTFTYAGGAPIGVLSLGAAGSERQITNVAAGSLTRTSTDAVNGSQLFATNQTVTGVGQRFRTFGSSTVTLLGGNSAYDIQTGQLSMSNVGGTGQDTVDGAISSVSATANKGWNLTAQGVSSSNVAPGASVDLKNSDGNVVVNKDTNSNGVTFDLAKDLKADSLTTGNSKLATSGLTVNDLANSTSYTSTGMTISNGPSVTTSGIDAGSLKIINVADGVVSSTSKDAVNGSQLFITNQNVAGNTTAINNINNGAGIKYFHANSTLADGTVTGTDSVVVGPSASATATNAMALGNGAVAGTANSIALGSGATTAAANPNTGGTINGVTFTYAGGAPIGVLSLGAAGSERQITNVAAGSLTRTSTDAVNGSQLFATNQSVEGVGQRFRSFGNSTVTALGGNAAYDIRTGTLSMSNVGGTGQDTVDGAIASVNVTANKGWNLTAQGVSSSNVAPGASVDLKNSDGNVVVNKDTNSNGVTFDLAKDLKADSLTMGNSKLATSGLTVNDLANSTSYTSTGMTISNGPSVTTSGIDAGSLKIINVADGVVSSTSKDSVNGSQLFITNQNVAGNTTAINNINNGAGIKYFHANSTLADGTVTGTDSVVVGPSASATATNAMALGNGAVAGTANSIALGSGATTAAANPNTGGTINGVTFTYAGGAPIGVLSLGAAGSERQITNVAAGSLTRTSTDAVNGSQLFATNQSVEGVGQRFRSFGNSTVTALGGNAAYDIRTGTLSMSNVGGTGQDTVDGAIASVNVTANKGWNLTAQGVSSSNVAPGASVDLKNSDGNVVVNKDTNSNGVTFDLAKNLKADSLTTGNSKLGTSGLTVNNLANSTSYTSTGMTISNGPSVTTSGIDAGSLKIINVADGVVSSTSKDAVNGSQLFITNQNVAGNTTAINNINNGAGIKYFHVNSTLADGTATGKDSVVVGPNALASSLRSMAIGNFASASNEDSIAIGADANASAWDSVSIGSISTAKGVAALAMGTSSTASGDYTIAIGPYSSAQGIGSVALGTDARALFADSIALGNGAFANNTNDVALGAHSTTGSASSHASDTIDGITYTYSGTSPTSVVSVGSAGQKRQITNVAAGNVSLTSTDAINGSQLFATNQAVNGVGQRVNTVGNSTATVFGGNAAYDNSTGKLSMSNVGGTGQNTVDGAISSMNAVVNKGWNLTAQSSGSTNVAPGASVDLKNSDGNVVVSKDTNSNDVTFDLSKNLTADILTTGFSKLDTSGLSVNDGANNAIYASTGMTISNGPSVTTSGIDAGSLKITHVADGALSSTSKDAVNGSQLNTTNTTVATNATNTNTYLGGGANVMNGTAPSYSVGGTTYNNVGDAFSAVDSGGAGVVQRTSVSDVVTMVAGGGTAANPGSAQKLTNLAAGTISSSSTDAVNGSQLNSVSQQANAGWNVTAQGANSTKVAPGASVDLKNSDGNVVVSKDTNSNDVTFNLAKDLTANSVTTGNTLVNTFGVQVGDDVRLGTTGLIIANGPRVTNVGIDAGSKKITHVADGTDATDGVNFSQLTSAVAGSKSHYYSVSDGGAQGGNYNNDGATGANAVAAGVGAVASGIDATALGSSSQATAAGASAMGAGAVASAAGATATGNGSKASGTGSVAMGDRAKASAEGSVALGSDASDGGRGAESYIGAYSGAQNNAVGTVSVGNASAGKTRTVSNVADGKQATDAVNLRQLDGAVKESKTYTDTQLTNVNTSVTTLGNQVTQNTANISNLQNGTDSFFQVNNKDGKSKPSATGTNAAAGAAGSVASGNSSLALGTSANATANNAVALGSGSVADRAYSVSVGSVGNERQITNVAAGTASTDVVNVSQLKSSEQGGLRYDSNTNGNTNYNQVTLGNGQASGGTRISNVAPGTAGTDAVNVNQLNQGMTSAIQYTDDRFNKLNRDIGSLRQDTYAGIAGALATANLPQAYSPGASMVAAGVGNYQGQSAVSVGLSTLSDNGKWVLKVSGTTNSRGQTGIGAGVGYQW